MCAEESRVLWWSTLDSSSRKTTPRTKAPTGNARRRVEATEAAMERAAARLAELDAALADPATFSGDTRRAAELGKARSEAQATLEAAESAWLEAVEALEALRA